MNRREIPPDKLNELFKMAGGNPKLQQNLRQGKLQEVLNSLSPQDAQTVRSILADPKQLQSVLASPEAQKLIKQIKNGR